MEVPASTIASAHSSWRVVLSGQNCSTAATLVDGILGTVVEVSLDGDSEATSVDEEERGQDWLEH